MNTADIIRRLENIIRVGVIVDCDYVNHRCTVQLGDIRTTYLPWLTARAGTDRTWDPPTKGEQCIVFSASGELSNGVVLTGLYSDSRPSPSSDPKLKTRFYEDGAYIQYNTETHHLEAILPEDGTATLTAKGGITINGNTTINGDLLTNGNATITKNHSVQGTSHSKGTISCDGDVTAGAISLQSHTHSGVRSGDSSTGGPQ